MLLNISRIKDTQAMKSGRLMEHPTIFFFKNYAEREVEKLVPDRSLFLKKLYIR